MDIWFGAVGVDWPIQRDPVYCLNPVLLTAKNIEAGL